MIVFVVGVSLMLLFSAGMLGFSLWAAIRPVQAMEWTYRHPFKYSSLLGLSGLFGHVRPSDDSYLPHTREEYEAFLRDEMPPSGKVVLGARLTGILGTVVWLGGIVALVIILVGNL